MVPLTFLRKLIFGKTRSPDQFLATSNGHHRIKLIKKIFFFSININLKLKRRIPIKAEQHRLKDGDSEPCKAKHLCEAEVRWDGPLARKT